MDSPTILYPTDKITIKNLVLRNQIGFDTWDRNDRPQPLNISLDLYTPTQKVGQSDTLCSETSVNYGQVGRFLVQWVEVDHFDSQYKSMESLAVALIEAVLGQFKLVQYAQLNLEKPKALLHADCAGVHVVRSQPQVQIPIVDSQDHIYIKNLKISTIIGLNPCEQVEKQFIVINLTCFPSRPYSSEIDEIPSAYNYRDIATKITMLVENTSFKTIEALAHHIARYVLQDFSINRLSLQVDKPSALIFAQSVGIRIMRDQGWLKAVLASEQENSTSNLHPPCLSTNKHDIDQAPVQHGWNTVYLGLGSNLGDRASYIHRALNLIKVHASIEDTSFMYLTKPMYRMDQPDFFNIACKIYTQLNPIELLDKLQEIERNLGRTEKGTNGPRVVDIDILLYNHECLRTDQLIIPHPRMAEREFVLRPLTDIASNIQHPTHSQPISQMLSTLMTSNQDPSPVQRIIPINEHSWLTLGTRTYIMGIINVTPDSFSDGGEIRSVSRAVQVAQAMVEAGADVLDIGGQSTRPHATLINAQDEFDRVVPVIQAIRLAGVTIPISIDTFWSHVARGAIHAGANIINDVSGGLMDPTMLDLVNEMHVPYIMMHMRGSPQSMHTESDYSKDGVIAHVSKELGDRVCAALRFGVPRYLVVVDPGLGFAKQTQDNLTLLHDLDQLDLRTFPILVGPSRKRFIGDLILQPDPKCRDWGTAAAVTACVARLVDLVRVHDVRSMRDVVLVADGVFRRG